MNVRTFKRRVVLVFALLCGFGAAASLGQLGGGSSKPRQFMMVGKQIQEMTGPVELYNSKDAAGKSCVTVRGTLNGKPWSQQYRKDRPNNLKPLEEMRKVKAAAREAMKKAPQNQPR